MKKRIVSHLKSDIKHEVAAAKEDRKLLKEVKHKKHHKKHEAKESKKHEKAEHHKKKHHAKKTAKKKLHVTPKREKKIEKVMREFKHGALHSGSKKGPKVKNRRQAIAISLSEARKV